MQLFRHMLSLPQLLLLLQILMPVQIALLLLLQRPMPRHYPLVVLSIRVPQMYRQMLPLLQRLLLHQWLLLPEIPVHAKTALRPSLHWLRGCQGAVLSNRARKLYRQMLLLLQMLLRLRIMLLSQAALLLQLLR